jgi:hypothetical protein
MTNEKAISLASCLGGEVVKVMPQSRSPGVRLALASGRVALLDELGGATFKSADAVDAYGTDGNDVEHVDTVAEWSGWGVTEAWATRLARLIGGEAYQSGGNIWVVLFERSDGHLVVVGDDGAEIYESNEQFERYYDEDGPEPEYVNWTVATTRP